MLHKLADGSMGLIMAACYRLPPESCMQRTLLSVIRQGPLFRPGGTVLSSPCAGHRTGYSQRTAKFID
jgi:hypothetical protein